MEKKRVLGALVVVVLLAVIVVAATVKVSSKRTDVSNNPEDAGGARATDIQAADACRNSVSEGFSTIQITSSGKTRSFDLFVFDGAQSSADLRPAILIFHGIASDPPTIESKSLVSQRANSERWFAIYPKGTGVPLSWNGAGCCNGNSANDLQFAKDIVTWLSSNLCLDKSRVFAGGFSNGGFMSNKLACEASAIFRAIAPHSGTMGTSYTCNAATAVPVIAFHGTKDNVVYYNGGGASGGVSFDALVSGWVSRNGCDAKTFTEKQITTNSVCKVYTKGCQAPVTGCTIKELAHTWSGGPATTNSDDMSATDELFRFFKQF